MLQDDNELIKLPPAGKGYPELQKFIKRKEIHCIDSPYQTNCLAEALSFFTMSDSKDKRYHYNERVAEGVRLKLQIQSILGDQIKDINSETVNEEMDENLKDVVQETQEAKYFNILMLNFENWVHILYILDPVALTGYRYCPNCKEHAVPVKNKSCNAA
ncbi:MAG: hypothetical protein EZS28_003992 [Streblomastix strix]|uniref:Uncharacterized protein n=1 Tax=Streblomastix strix TaxID=222440 RepID=A0A5J4X141_9EUKA|nr:MAG: hypothetical protein EZS28_003992 [Streblomastix strix]